jgi:S1-C subfamily serine protease
MDGITVSDIADIRIQLFYKQKGDTVKVRVLRNDKEMEFEVKL